MLRFYCIHLDSFFLMDEKVVYYTVRLSKAGLIRGLKMTRPMNSLLKSGDESYV